jgi:hypothetical protein
LLLLALSGCLAPPAAPQTFARAGKLHLFSEADIVTAVDSAEHSGYFTGMKISVVEVEAGNRIIVYYGPMSGGAGPFVVVERVHGRWQAVAPGAWTA